MKRRYIILAFIVIIGAFLRFYNLSWGSPYFFHPDERNIASAVSRLEFPNEMNPEFFAYGGFPIYLVYTLGALSNFLAREAFVETVSFGKAIMIGRYLSALLSTLLIPLMYLIVGEVINRGREGKKTEVLPLSAALITAFTPGFIQYAHFSTFEMILTFEYLLLFYFCSKVISMNQRRDYFWFGLILGLSLATKVTSLIMAPLLLLAHFLARGRLRINRNFFCGLTFLSAVYLLALVIGLAFSPYMMLDYSSFRTEMDYESTVAMGSLPVFYTAGFLKTIPLWHQLRSVFPFLLGFILCLLGVLSFLYLSLRLFFVVGDWRRYDLLLLSFFVLYFVFHGLMYVKWMRYMVPVIPFVIIFTVVALSSVRDRCRVGFQFSISLLCFLTAVSGLTFFLRYLPIDSRVQAADWAVANISPEARFLSESWDLGILPFNNRFPVSQIDLFDFYGLDGAFGQCGEIKITVSHVFSRVEELSELLEQSDYVVLPSRRVYGHRLRLPECFPNGNRFYSRLFGESLGFKKIYQTPALPVKLPLADVTAQLRNYLIGFFSPEETYWVFDYPTVIIFGKQEAFDQDHYQRLLLE